MKQITKKFLFLLVILIGVAACGKDEPPIGIWEEMKWEEPGGLTKVDGIYIVPVSGGTYKFTCKNYKPWIAEIFDYYDQTMGVWVDRSYEGTWYSVKCEGNDVTFTFRPLADDGDIHDVLVTLTAGDIFDRFRFIQRP